MAAVAERPDKTGISGRPRGLPATWAPIFVPQPAAWRVFFVFFVPWVGNEPFFPICAHLKSDAGPLPRRACVGRESGRVPASTFRRCALAA